LIHGFRRCGIIEINIPPSVEEIGGRGDSLAKFLGQPTTFAFCSCTMLYSVRFSPDSRLRIIVGFNETDIESITIPDSVLTIHGFTSSARLRNVHFRPGSVLETLQGFNSCPLLTSMRMPPSITEITGFEGTNIHVLDLPDSVETVYIGLLDRLGRTLALRVGESSRLHHWSLTRCAFVIVHERFLSRNRRVLGM
jgi:hypothetical protein